tara:strand:+ start:8174 stop:8815 length:642 start_codon:yes stop_codon:yes gene_type:complete
MNEITSVKFEPIESKPATNTMSVEDSARAIARQITNNYVKGNDADVQYMQSEFNMLSSKKKPVSFETWVSGDINRKMMFKSGADSALKTQYENLRSNFKSVKNKKLGSADAPSTADKVSKFISGANDSIDSRLLAVEEHVEHMSVGLDDHTHHLKMLKDGMKNHTNVLKKLATPTTGINSSQIMKKYAENSAMKGPKKRILNEQMAKKVTGSV